MSLEWPSEGWINGDALVVVDLITNCQGELTAQESPLAIEASIARLRELRAGRTAARRALHILDGGEHSILMSETGAPIWPQGYCGSISHSRKHICAIVGRSDKYLSIGVDVDDPRPIGTAAMAYVASRDELRLTKSALDASGDELDRIVFCIKEAAFKCFSSALGSADHSYLDIELYRERFSAPLTVRYRGAIETSKGIPLCATVHVKPVNDTKIVLVLLPIRVL